jgi:predicted alpha/beta hydrolase family esterase
MKTQVVVVHGGMAFHTHDEYLKFLRGMDVSIEYLKRKDWKDTLDSALGDGFDVVRLQMPNKMNAKYAEWKILFDKYVPLFQDGLVLVGHSLGGIFLAKYLSENDVPKKVIATYLLAAPFDEVGLHETLGDFVLPNSLERMAKQAGKVTIVASEDDLVVPVSHAERYHAAIAGSETLLLKGKGHLNQEEFPELVAHIRNA